MIMVVLDCRECNSRAHSIPIEFASVFEPESDDAIAETQEHIDKMFVAQCGWCGATDWEVTSTRPLDIMNMLSHC